MKRSNLKIMPKPAGSAGALDASASELELYRLIFNSAHDAIAIVDANGMYLEQNPAHEQMIGYSDQELHGQTPAIHLGADAFAEVARELARTGRYYGELPSRTKRGEEIIIELSAFTMHDAHGRVRCHVGVKRDVTERKRGDDELQSRIQQQAAVARLGQQALGGQELGALMQDAVASVAEMLGTEFCKLLEVLPDGKRLLLRAGVGWKDGLVGHATVGVDRQSHAGFTLRSVGPVVVEDLRTETRFNDASLREHNVISGMSVIVPVRGLVWGVLGAHSKYRRDFTPEDINFLVSVANVLAAAIERRQSEDALQESQQRLALAQRAANAATWDCNLLTGFITWAGDTKELFGADRDGLRTLAEWSDCLHPEDRMRFTERLQRAILERHDYDSQFRVVWHDGSVHWLSARGQVLLATGGTPTRMVGIVIDITARKQTEELLQRSEKLAMIGRLAASIAHEINNPLESVTNLLYLLEHYPQMDESARAYARLASQELARVSHISRQTLGFYRESAAPVEVNVAEVLDDVIRLYARKLERKHVRVDREYHATSPVHLYPAELRQVFSNLLMNAVEASPEHGTIRVRLNGRPNGVSILVADQGHGIAAEHRRRIFEPFFTTKGERGTGLGLWVSNGLVHKHGGYIRVRSSTRASHCGTVFSVFLPDAAARPGRAVEAGSR